MSNYTVETITRGVLAARVEYDHDATSPREWDNLSRFVRFTGTRSQYGIQGEESADDLVDALLDLAHRVDSLRAYDTLNEAINYRDMTLAHGVLVRLLAKHFVIYTLEINQDGSVSGSLLTVEDIGSGRFDGLAYVEHEAIVKEYGSLDLERATKLLKGEVEEYSRWASGDVYGVEVEDTETGHVLDSCWGFIGYDYALEEANRMLEEVAESKLRSVSVSGGTAHIRGEVVDLSKAVPFSNDLDMWAMVADALLLKAGWRRVGTWSLVSGVAVGNVVQA